MKVAIHAKIILKDPDHRILLIKRSYGNKTRDLPGGAIEFPETVEAGILREIKEETGITHVHGLQVVECISSYNEDEENYVVFLGYVGTTPEHVIGLSKEHEEYIRATVEQAEEVGLTPYLLDFLKKSGR